MVSQFKTVSIFVFFILFFPIQLIYTQQLALPNQDLVIVSKHKITVNEFVVRYSEYLFSIGMKDNIITRRSILNNMIGEYLLLVNVTLSIKTKIGFVNSQFLFPGELIRSKVFLFQHTNFIT